MSLQSKSRPIKIVSPVTAKSAVTTKPLSTSLPVPPARKRKHVSPNQKKRIHQKPTELDELIAKIESCSSFSDDEPAIAIPAEIRQCVPALSVLKSIQNLVGMRPVKSEIASFVHLVSQGMNDSKELYNFCVYGNTGVGKSTLIQLICQLYQSIGVIPFFPGSKGNSGGGGSLVLSNKEEPYIKVKRYNLIGKFQGETTANVQKYINLCMEQKKVLLLDEVYSLGHKDLKDSYAKEVQDCINQNLTDHVGELICVIAGYQDDVEQCFFAGNQGLSSRFTFRVTIDSYTGEELCLIFLGKLQEQKWFIDEDALPDVHWWNQKVSQFVAQGRSMDQLFTKIKMCHASRVFGCLSLDEKRFISRSDFERGFELFVQNNKSQIQRIQHEEELHERHLSMIC